MQNSEKQTKEFKTKGGRKVLMIYKWNKEVQIQLPADAKNSSVSYVDIITRENPPSKAQLIDNIIKLKPFSVAVINLKN